jgi:asparagine synthetase B (glutamine-hydrolysing)
MCGLVGMVGFLEHKHKQAMKELLYLDTLRGMDSTGLTSVDRNKQVLTRKMAVPGYEFIQHPVVDKAMGFADQLWIGHNRYKTVGAANRANAHPFEVLDDEGDVLLVGAHNGTLDNKWDIERDLGNERFDTDSEALFNLLVDQPTFKDAIAKLKGAWSLVWWDPTANALHFCRNDKRPLVYAFSKDRKVLVWASEAWMLLAACKRNGIELAENERGFSCYETIVDNLYTMVIPQERNVALPELQREGGYLGAPSNNFQAVRRIREWWHDDDPNQEPAKTPAQGAKETTTVGAPKPAQVIDIGFAKGFEGEPITYARFNAIKAKGCSWCKDPILKEDAAAFIAAEEVVCLGCLLDRHSKDGDRVRQEGDNPLDDDIPWVDDPNQPQEGTPEYRQLINAALGSAKAAIG